MAGLKYWVWLSECEGLSLRSKLLLLDHFASPEDAYFADEQEYLLVEGLSKAQAEKLADKSMARVDEILGACKEKDVRIVTMQDAEYPARLKNIYEPPVLLYVRGRLPAFDEEVALAMVGTRKSTPYGVETAEKLGFALASQGALIVSGGADGIDSSAHRGALRAGGVTVAVLGGGVDVPYPSKNEYLFRDIAATGALISEYPPGTRPDGWRFPIRNRIMSGLCLGTIVVEAPEKSGALITAELALEQGRDLFAVPGPIDAEMSRGCNRLLSEHAFVAMDSESVLREYRAMFPHKLREAKVKLPEKLLGAERREPIAAEKEEEKLPVLDLSKGDNGLTDDQIALLRALKEGSQQVDDLIERTEIPTRRVLSALTVLEIDGLVAQGSGKVFSLQVELQE